MTTTPATPTAPADPGADVAPPEVREAWAALARAYPAHDPEMLANMATVRQWLHDSTDALRCVNDSNIAVAVLVHEAHAPASMIMGDALCRACVTCTADGCTKVGVIFDVDYNEPWCETDAAKVFDDSKIENGGGQRIVLIDSPEYRQMFPAAA